MILSIEGLVQIPSVRLGARVGVLDLATDGWKYNPCKFRERFPFELYFASKSCR